MNTPTAEHLQAMYDIDDHRPDDPVATLAQVGVGVLAGAVIVAACITIAVRRFLWLDD